MTMEQWYFEAYCIAQREKKMKEERATLVRDVYTASTRAFRNTLISVLGTYIGADRPSDMDEADLPSIPLITLICRPEVVEELLERHKEVGLIGNLLESESADLLNEDLMNSDLDIDAMLSPHLSSDPLDRISSDEADQMLRELGIVLTDGDVPLEELFE